MRNFLYTVFASLLLCVATTAQSAPVKNTGCPSAPYASMTAAKINQTCTLTFPKMQSFEVPFLVLGYSMGRTVDFFKPFTCTEPCGFYVMPLITVVFPAGTTQVKIPIPNDMQLFQRCFAAQTAAGTLQGCLELHGAVSFCIGR